MSIIQKVLVAGLAAAACLFAQPALPDCFIQIQTATAIGTSASFDNRGLNCVDWTVEYNSNGFASLSVQFESSADNGGTPAAYVLFAGSVLSGVNPSTVLNQSQMTFTGYFPWTRLNVTALGGAGSITVKAYGFRPIPFPTLKTGNTTVTGPTAVGTLPGGFPVEISGVDSSGNNVQPIFCTKNTPVSLSASGLTQILALSGSTVIRVCHISIAFASGVDFQLQQGTGSNCAAGTANLTGLYKNVTTIALDWPSGAPLAGAASQALCVNLGAGVVGGGVLQYAQF